MSDRNRPTLRLRLPPSAAVPTRPAGVPITATPAPRAGAGYVGAGSGAPVRSGMGFAPRPTGPVRLDASSRAILEELAGLGLADPPEG